MPKKPDFCIEHNLTNEECANVPLTEFITYITWHEIIVCIVMMIICISLAFYSILKTDTGTK